VKEELQINPFSNMILNLDGAPIEEDGFDQMSFDFIPAMVQVKEELKEE
jgi:hypothetical protein